MDGSAARRLVGAAAVLATVGLASVPAPASAGTVLNRFERSCYWGCSEFKQVNGSFNGAVGSACVTKSWSGTSIYYRYAAGARC